MTDLIADIRAQLPGYTRRRAHVTAITAELARRQRDAGNVNPYKPTERDELERMLEAGDPLEELDQHVAARLAAEQAGAVAREALVQMQSLLRTELTAAENDATEVLPLLGKAMAGRVAEAEQLAPLEEIATPDATAQSKRYAGAGRLSELLEDITTLRTEQLRVLRAGFHEWGSKTSILHAIRNPAEVFPDTAVWIRPGYLVHRTRAGETQQIVTPWPWPLQTAMTTADFTLWALQHKARLWIPSPSQYDAAASALIREATQPRTGTREGDWVDPGPSRHERPTNLRQSSRGRPVAHVIEQ